MAFGLLSVAAISDVVSDCVRARLVRSVLILAINTLQWNLSNLDTLGTEESVLISEVS